MTISPYRGLCASFAFPYSSTTRAAAVDRWLVPALGADAAEEAALPPAYRADECARYAARVLRLARIILECWRVPVFDPARIVKLMPDITRAGSIRCEIVQPALEAVPLQAYENAYRLAAELCGWCCATPAGKDTPAAFHARLEETATKNRPPFELGGESTVPVLRAAHRLGLPFFHMGRGIYQVGTGARARLIQRSHGERDSMLGVLLTGEKAAAARILRDRGVPAPEHYAVVTREAASAAAGAIGFPVVVKPADANRGEGVSVNIASEQALFAAFDLARKHSRLGMVLVERQVPGVCHRLVIVKGQLLYALKRLAQFVTGDGHATLEALIAQAVAEDLALPYWLRSRMAYFGPEGRAALAASGVDLAAVPGHGERVFLRAIESTAWGGVGEETTGAVHPLNLKAAVDAAEAFGLDVAGIDMITTDISIPWTENGAIINEVNGGPLLGGGDTSRKWLPRFFEIYMGGNGLIPVEDAGAAWTEAVAERRAALLAGGTRCWTVFTDAALCEDGRLRPFGAPDEPFDHRGKRLRHEPDSAGPALRAALRNRAVEHVLQVHGPVPPALATGMGLG